MMVECLYIPGVHARFENDALDLVKFMQVCDEILLFVQFATTSSVYSSTNAHKFPSHLSCTGIGIHAGLVWPQGQSISIPFESFIINLEI